MSIGEAGTEEPMWVYLRFMRRLHREQQFVAHPNGIRKITGLVVTTPVPLRSEVAQIIIGNGILKARLGSEYLLEIEFDGIWRREQMDFRPHLPVIIQF